MNEPLPHPGEIPLGPRFSGHLSPFYFWDRGDVVNPYAVPLSQSETEVTYRVPTETIHLLLKLDQTHPGRMKRGLCWIAPYYPGPCWHQVQDISMKQEQHGTRITLHLNQGAHHVEHDPTSGDSTEGPSGSEESEDKD